MSSPPAIPGYPSPPTRPSRSEFWLIAACGWWSPISDVLVNLTPICEGLDVRWMSPHIGVFESL